MTGDRSTSDVLPTLPAHLVRDRPDSERWLIEGLWRDQAVGIVGGEPKCCKSFLALGMAVSVASGLPCLRRFVTRATGRVLLYPAEEDLAVVRSRLDGICRSIGASLPELDLHLITAPELRLDTEIDRRRLADTVEQMRPALLVLDPFVRLHRIDENASSEVAPILGFLRRLQRAFGVAIAIVHHARKHAGRIRGGQALRGSSEFHAWVDVTLYMRRAGSRFFLSVEHRDAAGDDCIPLALVEREGGMALEVDASPEGVASVSEAQEAFGGDDRGSLAERIEELLIEAGRPLSRTEIRKLCRARNASLGCALQDLATAGRVRRAAGGGYEVAAPPDDDSIMFDIEENQHEEEWLEAPLAAGSPLRS